MDPVRCSSVQGCRFGGPLPRSLRFGAGCRFGGPYLLTRPPRDGLGDRCGENGTPASKRNKLCTWLLMLPEVRQPSESTEVGGSPVRTPLRRTLLMIPGGETVLAGSLHARFSDASPLVPLLLRAMVAEMLLRLLRYSSKSELDFQFLRAIARCFLAPSGPSLSSIKPSRA